MKFFDKTILLIGAIQFCVGVCCLYSQNISGVVNVYTPVTATAANSVTVTNATGFTQGDRVLLIQIKGAVINTTNSNAFGDITNYNNAGNYEFLEIAGVSGNTISFTGNLMKAYTPSDKVQLVRVAVHPCPVVVSNIACPAWDGTTGGIIAIESPGTINMNADIDASGSGFRGGAFCLGGFGCVAYGFALNNANCSAAKKGEGIAEYIAGLDGGKGKQANGGGGGDPSNAGGGGGGNFSAGGQGGNEYSGCGTAVNNGRGGMALNYTTNRAFMGGSGGTGFNDNSQTVTSGANGGGLIFINANTVQGNGRILNSRGASVAIVANDESAGGGGAGGGVFLRVNSFTTSLTVDVRGGNGGSTYNNIFTTDCHAPGGGGGGGITWFSSASVPAGVTVQMNAGTPGTVQNPISSCYNTSFGAQNGSAGGNQFNLPPINFVVAPLVFSLGNDTTICQGQSIVLDAGAGYTSYLWSNGSPNQTLTVLTQGLYSCTVNNGCATGSDALLVTVIQGPQFSLGNDTVICAGENVMLNAGAGFTSYLWNDGSANQTFVATSVGNYSCTVTGSCGLASDTVQISAASGPAFSLGNDTVVCLGQNVVLDAGAGFTTYLWQDGSSNQGYTTMVVGNYSCTVTNNCGTATDVISVTELPSPALYLGNDTSICSGQNVVLDAGGGFNSYLWHDGVTNQLYTASADGNYSCTASNSCGTATDAIQVFVINMPDVFLGNDTAICSGQSVVLDAGGSFLTYLWQDGSSNQTFNVLSEGMYSCTATDGCGSDADFVQVSIANAPQVNLGTDLTICKNESVALDAFCSGCAYLWQDFSTNPIYHLMDGGTYSVSVTNNCGTAIDIINVSAERCDCSVFIPNAFTPNGDGNNDMFLPAFDCSVVYYTLAVFNRWGEKVFESANINSGWDGSYKNEKSQEGVYVYSLKYSGKSDLQIESLHKKGSISLIR